MDLINDHLPKFGGELGKRAIAHGEGGLRRGEEERAVKVCHALLPDMRAL